MIPAARSSARRPSTAVELWHFRELLRSLVVRNLKVKYRGSALGFVWTLLNPLLTVLVLVAVFGYVVRVPVPRYWAFLLSGYFVWNFLIQTLNSGTYVLAEHARLSRSVAFPVEVLVLGAAGSRFAEFAAELVLILAGLAVLHHGGVPGSFALVPLLLLLQLLLAVGLVMPIAALSAFYHDVQHALPIALTTLFYLSPVFYPVEMVPEPVQQLYFLNPLALLLHLYHLVLYEGRMPPPELVGIMAAVAVVTFFIGYAIFNRYKTIIPEIV